MVFYFADSQVLIAHLLDFLIFRIFIEQVYFLCIITFGLHLLLSGWYILLLFLLWVREELFPSIPKHMLCDKCCDRGGDRKRLRDSILLERCPMQINLNWILKMKTFMPFSLPHSSALNGTQQIGQLFYWNNTNQSKLHLLLLSTGSWSLDRAVCSAQCNTLH